MPVPKAFRASLYYQAEGLHADLAGRQFLSKCRYDRFCGLPSGAIAKGYMRLPRLSGA
jgi:hypothetical protein